MWCKRMLVGYDGSESAREALRLALKIAAQDRDIEIRVVHVLQLLSAGACSWSADAALTEKSVAIQNELSSFAAHCNNLCGIDAIKGSSVSESLIGYAEKNACDLIVMGNAGLGGVRGYLGSVSYAVIKDSPVPVLIARE